MAKKARILIGILLILLLTACSATGGTSSQGKIGNASVKQGLSITYLSVGQADAAVISCDGHYAMIDCGSQSVKDGEFSSYKIDLYLKQENIESLDYIFCSHYDEDHYVGFADIIENRKIGNVYGPSGSKDIDAPSMNRFSNMLKSQHKKIKTPKIGESLKLGNATIDVLAVDSDAKSKNDSSLVLLVNYGETKFLFPGDAERKTESALVNGTIDIKCDVLKVAHHGSSTSTSDSFLAKAKPEYAILSVAPDRDLPNGLVIDRLQKVDAKIFRTDETGNIKCTSDGKHISIYDTNGAPLN